jgi:hypothetical protein
LKTNDEKAKKIADNGVKFSKKYIRKSKIALYWFHYMINSNKLMTPPPAEAGSFLQQK